MRLKKIPDTYNDYRLEVSWGQIEALKNALSDATPDPVTDELAAELDWYMMNVPGPGQDEEEFKAETEGESSDLPDAPEEDNDSPIPMPPGEKPVDSIAGEGPPGGEEIDLESDEEIEDEDGNLDVDMEAEETETSELPEPPRE